MPIVVMGVSGAGKSTVAAALAKRLGWDFLDADDLHPPANVAKLRSGVPLTDADRAHWLDSVAAWIEANPRGVVACSALRRAYRDRLRSAGLVFFVHLDPPPAVLRERVGQRAGHFMPATQLPDQLATLQALGPDEVGLRVAGGAPVEEIVTGVLAALP